MNKVDKLANEWFGCDFDVLNNRTKKWLMRRIEEN